jgi:hypothetical protein
MKLICAWCQQEGVPAFLCEVEPLDDPTETHGICARHRFEVLQELDTTQSARTAVQGASAGGTEDQALLNRWIASSREMLDSVLPDLMAEVPSVARRAEAAERGIRALQERLVILRQEVAALQRERQQLDLLHAEVADLVNELVGRLAREVIQPLYDLMAKFNRISV